MVAAGPPLASTPPGGMEIARPSRARKVDLFLLVLRQHKLFALGYFLVASIIILALVAPLVAPFDPEEANASITLASPSASHWLGTDISGMDIFSRIIYSARIDLVIAVLGTCFSILIGGPLGLIAGYFSAERGRAGDHPGLGQHGLVCASDGRPLFRRRRRSSPNAGVGQHDRRRRAEHDHRAVVARRLPRDRYRADGARVCAHRRQPRVDAR